MPEKEVNVFPGGGHPAHGAHHHGGPGGMRPEPAKPGTISYRLKEETQDLHSAAEQHELQRSMIKGRLPKETYAQHLGQMHLIHRALGAHIRRLRPTQPALAGVVKDHQFQEERAAADLRTYGVDPASVRPTPATARLIELFDRAAKSEPLALLGHHYVLEGSNNGSRYIAHALRKAYALKPGEGDRFLDPYGDEQPAKWAEFKRDMEAQAFTPAQQDLLVGAARRMFQAISEMNEDLMPAAKA